MIFVFWNALDFLRLKKEIVSHKFKYCTSQWPNVGVMDVWVTQNNLWSTIFTSLNTFSEVFISKASVTHIHDFEENFVVEINFYVFPFHDQRIPFFLFLLLSLSFNFIDRLQYLRFSIFHLWDQFLIVVLLLNFFFFKVFFLWLNIELFIFIWQYFDRRAFLAFNSLRTLFLIDIDTTLLLFLLLLFKFLFFVFTVFRSLNVFKIFHTDWLNFVCFDLLDKLRLFMRL